MLVAYDTETTGLWKYGVSIEHEAQPKICSLSALLIEEDGEKAFKVIDSIDVIVKPEGWTIAPPVLPSLGITKEEAKERGIKISAADIHGITHERAMDEGVPLFEAMKAFNDLAVNATDGWLAHNESYDNLIIRHALKLLKRTIPLPEKRICTMMMAKDYCRLPPNRPGGDWKWPKLEEAYRILFGKEMIDAHNSLADIQQTVEVYQELKCRGVPDAGPVQERKGMKLADWAELGWSRERIDRVLGLQYTGHDLLTEWDKKFISSMNDRISKFGEYVYLSEKQIDIMKRLEETCLKPNL